MAEIVDCDVSSLELEKLLISKPKKTDDSLFGKISYDQHQLNVHFYNSVVVKHKRIKHLTKFYTVLILKVPKKQCKAMVDFDNHCIEQVKSNIGGWFSKALDENVIEEYYTSSVILSKNDGPLIKIKVQGCDDLLESTKYDLVISLKGLRFYKQRFIPEWEIVNLKQVEDDFINSIQSDEENTWEDELVEDNVVPEPDEETLNQISEAILNKLNDNINTVLHKQRRYEQKIESTKQTISYFNDIINKVKNNRFNLSILDEVSNELDELEVVQ